MNMRPQRRFRAKDWYTTVLNNVQTKAGEAGSQFRSVQGRAWLVIHSFVYPTKPVQLLRSQLPYLPSLHYFPYRSVPIPNYISHISVI